MATKEILTLQFGPYSNFIGTHWWNMQELSFNYDNTTKNECKIIHDVLFREGETPRGETTYTPRMLAADLQGNLKTLPEYGTLYEAPHSVDEVDAVWMNKVEKISKPPIAKNSFLKEIETGMDISQEAESDLYANVKVWSDFLYSRFHPRSVNVIKQYQEEDFDSYPLGCSTWKEFNFHDDFTDKMRQYVEECDHLQGFQILMDATNGFSGLGSSCVEYLSDEYAGKTIFTMPMIPSYYSDYNWETDEEKHRSATKDSVRVLNLLFSFEKLIEETSIFSPLCLSKKAWRKPSEEINFNHINYKTDCPYQTSAVIASAVNTFSLKYRLKNNQYHLMDLTADLTKYGRKAVAASLCFPFPVNQGETFLECLDKWEGPLTQCITPHCSLGDNRLIQLFSLRGIPESILKLPLEKAVSQRDLPAYKCQSVAEMLTMYCSYSFQGSSTRVSGIEKGLCVKPPFPQIVFDDRIGVDGNIMLANRPDNIRIEEVPALAGLHSGSEIGLMVESLHSEARRIKLNKFQQFVSNGLGKDEFEECLDKIFTFRECYEDNYFL